MATNEQTQNRKINDSISSIEKSLTNYFQAEAMLRKGAGQELLNSLDKLRETLRNAKFEVTNHAAVNIIKAMERIDMADLNDASVVARQLRDYAELHPWNFDI